MMDMRAAHRCAEHLDTVVQAVSLCLLGVSWWLYLRAHFLNRAALQTGF